MSSANNRLRAAFDMNLFDHGFIRALNHNMAEVGPGVWRSNQPSPRRLKSYADDGFKTIVNLRGPSTWGSYELEKIACAEYGLTLLDIRLHSRAPPQKRADDQSLESCASDPSDKNRTGLGALQARALSTSQYRGDC